MPYLAARVAIKGTCRDLDGFEPMRSLAFPPSRRQLQRHQQRGPGLTTNSPTRQEWRDANLLNCRETPRGQPAAKPRKTGEGSTTIPHSGVEPSGSKQQEARPAYDIVCSAWQHAAANRRVRRSEPDGTQRYVNANNERGNANNNYGCRPRSQHTSKMPEELRVTGYPSGGRGAFPWQASACLNENPSALRQ